MGGDAALEKPREITCISMYQDRKPPREEMISEVGLREAGEQSKGVRTKTSTNGSYEEGILNHGQAVK